MEVIARIAGFENCISVFAHPAATDKVFFITDDGYLISNYHVVKDATKVRLLNERRFD